jgi:hypothetical protein
VQALALLRVGRRRRRGYRWQWRCPWSRSVAPVVAVVALRRQDVTHRLFNVGDERRGIRAGLDFFVIFVALEDAAELVDRYGSFPSLAASDVLLVQDLANKRQWE